MPSFLYQYKLYQVYIHRCTLENIQYMNVTLNIFLLRLYIMVSLHSYDNLLKGMAFNV